MREFVEATPSAVPDYADEIAILVRHLGHERDCTAAVLDTANSLIVVLDAQGRIERLNRAHQQICNCVPGEAGGRFWWDISCTPQESEARRALFERMSRQTPPEFPLTAEIPCFTREGEARAVVWTFSVILSDEGTAEYFVGVGEDRTEQRAAEERFSRIFYSSPVPIGITTLDEGRFLFANDALLQMFGARRAEFIGRTAHELGMWGNAAERDAVAGRLRNGERVTNVPLQGRDRQGQAWFALSAFERIEIDGVACALCVSANITEHRVLQENLRALAEGISSVSSGAFFESAVRHLAGILDMNYAVIGELLPDSSERLRTVAQFHRGRLLENVDYDLSGTLCGAVIQQGVHAVPRDVQQLFPQAEMLSHFGAQSYVCTPLHDSHGQTIGLLAVLDDEPLQDTDFAESVLRVFATRAAAELERRHAEESLRASENRYRALAEGSAVGIWQLDLERNTTYLNPAMCRLLEIEDLDELHRLSLYEFFSPESQQIIKREMSRRATGETSSYEAQIIGRRGGRYDVLISGAPLLNAEGAQSGFIGTFIDVSQRKHAELALRQAKAQLEIANADLEKRVAARTAQLYESEERLRQVTENIPYVIWMCENDFETVSYVNSAFEKVWGYSREELYQRPQMWSESVVPEDRPLVFAVLQEKSAGDDLKEVEYRIQRPDGEIRWIRDRAFAIRNQQGEIYRYAGISEDITQRRQMEESLRAAHAAAERANQAKSEFLSRMSHELRTPLNAILGFAQLLDLDMENAEQRESVEQILRAGNHLLGMIDEVLDIARIESGHLRLSLEPVCIIELVSECLSMVRPLAEQRQVKLHCDAANEEIHQCEYVLADMGRLRQVLLNYLSNAVKYNRHGGQVWLSWENTPGERLRVNVSDTGPGIAPEKMPLLFVPFERLDAEMSEISGSGLGLALCKRLIEVQNGSVGVESVVGQGSNFWFVLPRTNLTAQDLSDVAPAKEASPVGTAAQASRTVLYIEDNPSNLRLMERLMEQRPQWHLTGVKRGYEGLAAASATRPDAILLDVQLPDIQGDEVLRLLKLDSRLRDVPVVIISADAIPLHVQNLLAAGAHEYLTKPLDLRRCLQLLDELLTDQT